LPTRYRLYIPHSSDKTYIEGITVIVTTPYNFTSHIVQIKQVFINDKEGILNYFTSHIVQIKPGSSWWMHKKPISIFTSHIVQIKLPHKPSNSQSDQHFTSHIVQIKQATKHIQTNLHIQLFTSHIVQIKLLRRWYNALLYYIYLYIPHSSDKTLFISDREGILNYFTSHIVQIKRKDKQH